MTFAYVSPIPARLQKPVAIMHDRAGLAARTCELEELIFGAKLSVLARYSAQFLAIGCTADVDPYASLLNQYYAANGIPAASACSRLLVIELPKAFETKIAAMVVQEPQVFNDVDADLQTSNTYLSWTTSMAAGEDGIAVQNAMEVRVHENDLNAEMNIACGIVHASSEAVWCWVPVVMVAGQKVAVGGFACDEAFVAGLQAATMSAQSYSPHDVYTPAELEIAAWDDEHDESCALFQRVSHIHGTDVLSVRVLHFNPPKGD
jgi:hypothetical protein